jgi:hypothetical protein
MAPEARLAEAVPAEDVGRCPQRAVGEQTRDASRSNSSASSLEIARWCSVLCACASDSVNARIAALGSRYFLRECLGRVAIGGDAGANATRTVAPGEA